MKPEDLDEVLDLNLRTADQEEIVAATGLPVQESLLRSIAISNGGAWVGIHKDRIEAVFGVVESPFLAVPWFVATDKFHEFWLKFVRESREFIYALLDRYGLLVNFVDSRHTEAIRWLRWLGFVVDETRSIILSDPDVPFFRFYLTPELLRLRRKEARRQHVRSRPCPPVDDGRFGGHL